MHVYIQILFNGICIRGFYFLFFFCCASLRSPRIFFFLITSKWKKWIHQTNKRLKGKKQLTTSWCLLLSVLLCLLQHKCLPVRADNDHTACTHLLAWNNFHNQSENQYPTLSCNESISTLSVDNLGLVFLGNEKMLYTTNWINYCAVLSAPTGGSSQTVPGSPEAHVQIFSRTYTFSSSSHRLYIYVS